MSTRRRVTSRSPSPVDDASDILSPSPPRRQSREVRISTSSASGGGGGKQAASRTRRPTPVVRRTPKSGAGGRISEVLPHDHHHHHRGHHSRNQTGASDEEQEDDDDDDEDAEARDTGSRQISINTRSQANGRGGKNRQVTLSSSSNQQGSRTALDGSRLSWYERMLPECVLNMTAPLTGYESSVERLAELDDYEYEILERERVRRNRRIRRRLLAVMLVASLASAYFIYRGRVPYGRRPPGVRGAINAMTSRLEDGLSKTIHDTMGK